MGVRNLSPNLCSDGPIKHSQPPAGYAVKNGKLYTVYTDESRNPKGGLSQLHLSHWTGGKRNLQQSVVMLSALCVDRHSDILTAYTPISPQGAFSHFKSVAFMCVQTTHNIKEG